MLEGTILKCFSGLFLTGWVNQRNRRRSIWSVRAAPGLCGLNKLFFVRRAAKKRLFIFFVSYVFFFVSITSVIDNARMMP